MPRRRRPTARTRWLGRSSRWGLVARRCSSVRVHQASLASFPPVRRDLAISTLISAFNSLTFSPRSAPCCSSRARPKKRTASPAHLRLIGAGLMYTFMHSFIRFSPPICRMLWPRVSALRRVGPTLPFRGVAGALHRLGSGRSLNAVLAVVFTAFTAASNAMTGGYIQNCESGVAHESAHARRYGVCSTHFIAFSLMPRGFIPNQDKGYLIVISNSRFGIVNGTKPWSRTSRRSPARRTA